MFMEAGSQTAIVFNSAAVCSPLLHDRPPNALGFSTFLKGIDEDMKLNQAIWQMAEVFRTRPGQ
jgi:hypothetical protein